MNKKITFLAGKDYANVLTEYSYAINHYLEGYESKIICKDIHHYQYEKKHDFNINKKCNMSAAKKWIKESEYVIFAEETGEGRFPTLTYYHQIFKINFFNTKKVCVWHPGTQYRNSYKRFNKNPINNKFYKRLYAVDLYRLSPKTDKDKILLPYKFLDIKRESLLELFKNKIQNPPYLILHAPSSPNKKGTQLITKQIKHLNLDKNKFRYSVLHSKPNNIILNNKTKSLFYIDQFNDRGGFGVASIESLLCGNFTFSRIDKSMVGLEKFYRDKYFPIINLGTTTTTLEKGLKEILSLDEDSLLQYAEKYVDSILHFYSPQNIIKEFVCNVLEDG